MAFTKIAAAGIGSTELVTLHSLEVLNNATVGGVLTYEDVTNVDSIGLITARNGIVVGSGITLSKDGDIFATGVSTVTTLKVGSGVTVSSDGHIFATGVTTSTTFVGNLTGDVTGAASQITVADESSDTDAFVVFTNTATGNNAPKTGSNLTFNSSSGALTATSFVGSGANLTGITGTTINNNADNRLITGSGSANTLNGESTLTFDGSLLKLQVDSGEFRVEAANGVDAFSVDSDNGNTIIGGSGTLTIPDTIVHAGDTDTKIRFPDADTITAETGGSERLRIASDGQATFDKGAPASSNQVIARFQAQSSRALDIVWHESGSLLGFDTPGDHSYIFKVNSTEKMRLTSTGLGINSDSSGPDKLLHVSDSNNGGVVTPFRLTNVAGTSGTEVRMEFECGLDEVAYIGAKNEGSDIGPLMFATASSQAAYPTEKMRLTNDGRLLVHTTTSYNGYISSYATAGQPYPIAAIAGNTSQGLIGFYYSTSLIGSITYGGGSTAYNTSSDYRLKENVTPISDGITRLKTLKPSRFNFKVDKDTTVDGFLAHEVSSIVPEAITGSKDEVDSDNNPVYQQIDQSKIVPVLTAALQEAIAKIETLETKVAALEG